MSCGFLGLFSHHGRARVTPRLVDENQILTEARLLSSLIPRKRKKALLIGINYTTLSREKGRLFKPHDDVATVQNFLIELYGYRPDDITVLMDHESTPGNLRPTKVNIIQQMINLVTDIEEGDEFFFYYAGHATQRDEKEPDTERDHMDEYILPLDAMSEGGVDIEKAIEDDRLREILVQPLLNAQVKCQLIAVMDTCYSGTLLDLEHDLCNQVIGWRSRLFRILRAILETPPEARSRFRARAASWLRDDKFECNRICNRKGPSKTKANVICISACEDSQELVEMTNGNTLAGLLDIYLRTKDKRPCLKKLNRFIYEEFKKTHRAIWKSYKVERRRYRKNLRGKPPKPPKERDKPQISSLKPLRMNTLLKL